jgi:hypothetical protein
MNKVFSPDLLMPAANLASHEAEWRSADAQGSADHAYAVGVLLWQREDHEAARCAWDRAASRGSADATYVIGQILASEGDVQGYVSAMRRADAAGSMLAAGGVAGLALAEGDSAEAAAATDRLHNRATAADKAGSADAALVLAQLQFLQGDDNAAVAAWKRAERRGSIPGALYVYYSQYLLRMGNLQAAEAAARRAEAAGVAAGSYQLAAVFHQRRESRPAWEAMLRAMAVASSTGDIVTLSAARQALRPYGWRYWSIHRIRAAALATCLALLALLAGWRWAIAAVALLGAFAVSQRPIVPGLPLPYPDEESDPQASASIAGLTVSGFYGIGDPLRRAPRPVRAAVSRDTVYFRLSVLVVALASVGLIPWAAGAYGDQIALRIGLAAIAVLAALSLAWQWPYLGEDRPSADEQEADSAGIMVSFSPFVFWTVQFRFWLISPELVKRLRRHANSAAEPVSARGRALRRLLALIAPASGIVLLGALAVSTTQRQVIELTLSMVSTAIEALVICVGVSLAIRNAVRATRRHDAKGVALATAYLITVGAVVYVANWWGLLAGWDHIFR